jgi:hypothetical protein
VINIKQLSSSFVAKDNEIKFTFCWKGQNEMDVNEINFLLKWTGFRLILTNKIPLMCWRTVLNQVAVKK